jgi:hypothetical protein
MIRRSPIADTVSAQATYPPEAPVTAPNSMADRSLEGGFKVL